MRIMWLSTDNVDCGTGISNIPLRWTNKFRTADLFLVKTYEYHAEFTRWAFASLLIATAW